MFQYHQNMYFDGFEKKRNKVTEVALTWRTFDVVHVFIGVHKKLSMKTKVTFLHH